MTHFSFKLNGQPVTVDVDPSTPLLWVLRDHLGLTGTKFGCGAAQCGACTVHVAGDAVRSCSMPIDALGAADVTTIEGLAQTRFATLQEAWISHQVPQCGYCQPGFLMATAALLAKTAKPTAEDLDNSITNICRCGTYRRIREAILSLG
ncbi:(2Fe-2S)-binding protein [Phreatobacter stygius]|uniref:(2Fe-2S)-binding protein n=1 Tax=Phreatobacter stygius TaxID=1940610 RepID=A0A4D7AZT7_9HYPH|nr:(2Fe-2S)-binding protein [Phreatobacter stygius]QCI66859.1 (2Fe-2S)-binding protein [Phreatobacter stygius]